MDVYPAWQQFMRGAQRERALRLAQEEEQERARRDAQWRWRRAGG